MGNKHKRHRFSRLQTALVLLPALGILFLGQGAVSAGDGLSNTNTGGLSTGDGGAVGVSVGTSSPGSSGPSRASGGPIVSCFYAPSRFLGAAILGAAPDTGYVPEVGEYVQRVCRSGGRVVGGLQFVTYGEGARSPVEVAGDAADIAFAELVVPEAVVGVSPLGGMTLPGLDTWFWVEGTQSLSETASLGAVTATVTATFGGTKFSFADAAGHDTGTSGSLECADGGVAYDPSVDDDKQSSDCVWIFGGSSRPVEVTAEVTWNLEWSSSVGAGGVLNDVVRTTVETVEVQALRSVIRDK